MRRHCQTILGVKLDCLPTPSGSCIWFIRSRTGSRHKLFETPVLEPDLPFERFHNVVRRNTFGSQALDLSHPTFLHLLLSPIVDFLISVYFTSNLHSLSSRASGHAEHSI